MTAILRHESRNQLKSTSLLGGLLVAISFFFLAVFPGIREEAEALEAAFPDILAGMMGFEELHTIEGFTSGWLFPFIWVLLIGIYFAYTSSSFISGDIRSRQLDLLLSNPVSRESVVLQKFASLWVPLVALNAVLFIVLVAGSFLIGETIDIFGLLMTQLLSVPYLLVCGAIGMILSVAIDRVGTAQAGAIGMIFILWMLEGVSELDPDYELLGLIAPSRYYDPSAILVRGEYVIVDAVTLLFGTAALLTIAIIIFVRRDL